MSEGTAARASRSSHPSLPFASADLEEAFRRSLSLTCMSVPGWVGLLPWSGVCVVAGQGVSCASSEEEGGGGGGGGRVPPSLQTPASAGPAAKKKGGKQQQQQQPPGARGGGGRSTTAAGPSSSGRAPPHGGRGQRKRLGFRAFMAQLNCFKRYVEPHPADQPSSRQRADWTHWVMTWRCYGWRDG